MRLSWKRPSPDDRVLEFWTPRPSVSVVDARNPTVFITSEALFSYPYLRPSDDVYTSQTLLHTIEHIRQAGAKAKSLDPSAQAQLKIAILGIPLIPKIRPPFLMDIILTFPFMPCL